MSLLDKIKCIDLDAGWTLHEQNFNDTKIKSLTPEDLHILFPGPEYEKLRLAIMDLISPKTQVDTCLKKLKNSIQPDSLRAALSNNDVLDDYLNILRGMKNQMDHVQSFLDAHINFLEEIRKEKPGESSYKEADGSDMQTGEVDMTSEPPHPHPSGERPLPEMQTAQGASEASQSLASESESLDTWDTMEFDSLHDSEISGTCGQPVPQPKQAQGHQKNHMTYQIVVSGKTFDADQQLMTKLKKKVPLVEFDKRKQNHEITILFCPISTRTGLDIKAAMDEVKDNKPIILVLMHHYPEPRCIPNRKTWEDYPNIEFFVNVFYHDSVSGLIKCEENDQAIDHIKGKLAEIYTRNNPETSKTAQWLRPEGDQAVADEQTSGKSNIFKKIFG